VSKSASSDQSGQTPDPSPKPKRAKPHRWWLALLVVLLGLVVTAAAAGAGAFFYAKHEFEKPGPPAAGDMTVVMIPKGFGVAQIGQRLEQERVISNALLFRLGARFHGADQSLKAGEYAIPARASMHEIMEILQQGKAILHRLTIAEGLTSAQAMRLVDAHEILIGDTPETPAEGTLLPETYLFPRGTTRAELVDEMQRKARTLIDELWSGRDKDLPFDTKEEALILASIVEKETGIAEERGRVAAVFVNRLRRGMRLESDPTIIVVCGAANWTNPTPTAPIRSMACRRLRLPIRAGRRLRRC